MIKEEIKKQVKAVGMISGGLDSTLAAKIIKDLGVDVYGVYFSMPWGCCDKTMAIKAAQEIGIKFIVLQLDERYLQIVEKPKHGYGTALNPCVDCRIHMFKRAADYMRQINADFLFTGDVLGQRPMSQKRNSMKIIERESGLEGILLRPLSAQLLEETKVERDGLIDRKKLLNLVGRSRREQYALAEDLNVSSYNQPAGGCLLTDNNFAARMKDTFKYGYRNFRETIALKWGRHFRLDDKYKIILGRNSEENDALIRYAHIDDMILAPNEFDGATLILKGENPSEEILSICGGFIQWFSKHREQDPLTVRYWPNNRRDAIGFITVTPIDAGMVERLKI